MTWQLLALLFAAGVWLAHWYRWARRQPTDFTHVRKVARFKQYQREIDADLRRRQALRAEHR